MTNDVPAAPLSCQELVELVTSYLEGSMPGPERARFDSHLDMCTGCRRYLDQMRRTIVLVGRLTTEDVSPQAREDLLAAFRDWKRGNT
jgi:predicted anti-sigma-YlaC factor YlaD